MESLLRIKSIKIASYKILPEHEGGYVKLYVIVEGRTRFMHPLCLEFNHIPAFKFSTRYSELLCLHLELKQLFPILELPTFPKKKWIGSRSESFIAKRIHQLNEYFAEVTSNPEFNPSEPLMRLISPARPLNIIIIGGQRVGKQLLLELFIKYDARCNPEEEKVKSSMCSQEVVKSTPIDMLIDEKLFRISNLEIKTFHKTEAEERNFLNEALADKNAAIFMYRERGTPEHGLANRMYEMTKTKTPCILANCDTSSYINEYTISDSRSAFLAFEALIRILKTSLM